MEFIDWMWLVILIICIPLAIMYVVNSVKLRWKGKEEVEPPADSPVQIYSPDQWLQMQKEMKQRRLAIRHAEVNRILKGLYESELGMVKCLRADFKTSLKDLQKEFRRYNVSLIKCDYTGYTYSPNNDRYNNYYVFMLKS